MTLFIVIGLLYVLPVFVAVSQGRAKGRDGWVYGVLLGWLGVLVLALLPPVVRGKRCPDCAEIVAAEARVCRFCGLELDRGEEVTGRLRAGGTW